jgi:hypothetical protein
MPPKHIVRPDYSNKVLWLTKVPGTSGGKSPTGWSVILGRVELHGNIEKPNISMLFISPTCEYYPGAAERGKFLKVVPVSSIARRLFCTFGDWPA